MASMKQKIFEIRFSLLDTRYRSPGKHFIWMELPGIIKGHFLDYVVFLYSMIKFGMDVSSVGLIMLHVQKPACGWLFFHYFPQRNYFCLFNL